MLLEAYRQRARSAHNWTSFSPEKRGDTMIRDYSAQLEADMREVEELGGDPADYRTRYERLFSAWIGAKSRCFSSMITGPAKFPTRRHEKATASEQNHYQKFEAFREKYIARLKRNQRREERAQVDPVAEMRAKVERAERNQERMKAANKVIQSKKTSDAEKVALLMEQGFAEPKAVALLQPDFCGRIGFPAYALTNNLANIKRMRQRLAELEKKAAATTEETTRPDGIRIVENAEADRLQIFFPEKPAPAMIQNLKSRGFRWSPSGKCWQRQLTGNARWAAQQILPE